MAYASTTTQQVRTRITSLYNNMQEVDSILQLIEDPGVDDVARKTFFESYLLDEQGQPTTDLSWTEFVAAILVLRELRTWLTTNRPKLFKMRV